MTRPKERTEPNLPPRGAADTLDSASDRRASPPNPPNNLPAFLTPFIGQQAQVDAVCSLIVDEDVRLLPPTGPGGVGKTRLAPRAPEAFRPRFEDGPCLVALAPRRGP